MAQTESEKDITPSEKDTLTTSVSSLRFFFSSRQSLIRYRQTEDKKEINSPVTPFTPNITESTSNTGGLGNDHLDFKTYEALGTGVGGGIIAAAVAKVDTSRDHATSEQVRSSYAVESRKENFPLTTICLVFDTKRRRTTTLPMLLPHT